MNKYRAIRKEVDGIKFHSKDESYRYSQLKMLVKANQIKDLECHPKYDIIVEGPYGETKWTYSADFKYYDNINEDWVVEDVKSPATAKLQLYKRNKECMKVLHNVEIRDVYMRGKKKNC